MPTPTRDKERLYAGRRPDRVQLSINIDREARDLLDLYAPARAVGRFLARLVFEHDVRMRERARLKALVDEEVGHAGTKA